MDHDVILYNNEFWRLQKTLTYTGEPQPIHLSKDVKYLLECNGGLGGTTVASYAYPMLGGTSYGEFDCSEDMDVWGYVGGNGENSNQTGVTALGGWNGGGSGGMSTNTSYRSGAGGGGATDIRLYKDGEKVVDAVYSTDINPNYEQIEYVETFSVAGVYCELDVIPHPDVRFESDVIFKTNSVRSFEALFGSRRKERIIFQHTFFHRFNSANKFEYGLNTTETEMPDISVYDKKVHLDVYKQTVSVYDYETGETKTATHPSTPNYGYALIYLFDLNNAANNGRGTNRNKYDTSAACVKLYNFSVKMCDDEYQKMYLVPVVDKQTEIFDMSNVKWSQGSFNETTQEIIESLKFITSEKIEYDASINSYFSLRLKFNDLYNSDMRYSLYTYDENESFLEKYDSLEFNKTKQINAATKYIYISIYNKNDTEDMTPTKYTIKGKIFSGDNSTVYMFDIINNRIYNINGDKTGYASSRVLFEDERTKLTIPNYDLSIQSRIIVAAGAGGMRNCDNASQNLWCFDGMGFGGGVYGSIDQASNIDPRTFSEAIVFQDRGYAFGFGKDGSPKVSGGPDHGMSGAGGGWYGGYTTTPLSTDASLMADGQGGSGYVLTETSFRPSSVYMQGVDISKYVMHDPMLKPAQSDEPCIRIYTKITSYALMNNDVIYIPCTASQQQFELPIGTYTFTCYGGAGGTRRRISKSSRGGKAVGTMQINDSHQFFVNVGGSGVMGISYLYQDDLKKDRSEIEWQSTMFPEIGYNGGGRMINTTENCYGGGATDFRIDGDTLYHRFIVAGGAGGMGRQDYYGGAGGGTTGGQGNTSCGTQYGPGKQNAAGAGDNKNISGSFGFGGSGYYSSGGYGGAGGGGWYGGSGCAPDGSGDDDSAGSGGSGYALTETSFKPTDYKVDNPEYYLSDVELITGGNDMDQRWTKAFIEVRDIKTLQYLCHDDEGLKYFNELTNSWEYFSSAETPTLKDFEDHTCYKFLSDDGLLNNYTIYMYSPHMEIPAITKLYVTPNDQIVRTSLHTDKTITKMVIDADGVDKSVSVAAKRVGVADDAGIDFTIKMSYDGGKETTKLYSIKAETSGDVRSYGIPQKKEKTIEHLDLLPVGRGNATRIPSTFRSYIGGFTDDEGSVAITGVPSAAAYTVGRYIYTASQIHDTKGNNRIIRFCRLSMTTNKVTKLLDINKTAIINNNDFQIGGFVVDDNYFYLTAGYSMTSTFGYIYRIDRVTGVVKAYAVNNDPGNYVNAHGDMTITEDGNVMTSYRYGFYILNTKTWTTTWWYLADFNSQRIRIAFGKKKAMAFWQGNTTSAYVFDYTDKTYTGYKETYTPWKSDAQPIGCYGDGKFYVTQQGYLYILDEDDMTKRVDIVTPYSSLQPSTISYGAGIVYITISGSPTVYMYDIKEDRFSTVALPFTMNNPTNTNGTRYTPCTFKSYFIIPQMKLFITSMGEYNKYDLGYKYNNFMIICNNESDSKFEYDERFITVNDSYIEIHNGYISYEQTILDEENRVFSIDVNKKDYKKFVRVDFDRTKIDETDEKDEKEEDENNGT